MITSRSLATLGWPIFLGTLAGCMGSLPVDQSICDRPGVVPVSLNELWLRDQPLNKAEFAVHVSATGPVFDDPREVFKLVMRASPPRPVIYPTERYYYYKFPDGPRLVSGNIRFADAERGTVSVGYFDTHNPSDMRVGHFDSSQPGVSIRHDAFSQTVTVTVDDIRRIYVLDQSAFQPPRYPLYEGEQFVSGVRDESGYFFHLIYHRPSRSFYYVLQPDQPLPEPMQRGASTKIRTWFGAESRFCFIEHPPSGRKILVGVHRREIMENSWYDGPFDQVPPRLPIRGILIEAYPYVVDAGGIDEHGNFLEMEGQRVAISPYRNYVSGPQLESELEEIVTDEPSPEAWIRATYEYKKDWRAPGVGGHTVDVSRSWPANHWGGASRQWGEHSVQSSVSWQPNHEAGASRLKDVYPSG